MSNVFGSFNLSAFKKAKVTVFTKDLGDIKAGSKVLIIPIEENKIVETEKGGLYFNFIAFPSDKIKDMTHSIKQSFKKEDREAMSEEEKKSQPFFGNLRTGDLAPTESTAQTVVATEDIF